MEDEHERLTDLSIAQLERELVEEILTANEPIITGDLGGDVSKIILKLKEHLHTKINENQEVLRQKVCDEWDYCNRTKDQQNDMIMLLVDSGLILLFELVVPAVTLAIYLVRLGYFDSLCGCRLKDA
jgi:hypothetical protein